MSAFDSFEQKMRSIQNDDVPAIQKYPLKRLEPSIKKFNEVIDINIDRLERHKINIDKFKLKGDWSNLSRENTKAITTVQQVKASIKEIENTRNKVVDADIEQFDKRVSQSKLKAINCIDNILYAAGTDHRLEESGSSCSSLTSSLCNSSDYHTGEYPALSSLTNSPVQALHDEISVPYSDDQLRMIHTIPEDSDVAASYASLERSLIELSDLIKDFASTVQAQQEPLDSISENIETAQINVSEGGKHLGKAAKYSSVVIPTVGATIGLIVGGPIGLIAGAKLGALAAGIGGTLGFVTGRVIKKRQDNITNIELDNMTKKDSD